MASQSEMSCYTEEWAKHTAERISVHTKAIQTYKDIQSYLWGNKKVLDIGCGSGVLVNKLTKQRYIAYGYDTALENIAYAKKHFYGNYYDQFPTDNEFDVITMVHVLEHIKQPLEYLKKVWDILAENGIIHIIVPNNRTVSGYFGKQYQLLIYDPNHNTFWEPDNLTVVLKQAGFHVVNVRERFYWGMLFAVALSKYYRMIFCGGKHSKPSENGGNNSGTKLQGIWDAIDYIFPCVTKLPGKLRIFNEVVVTARKEKGSS